jgi:hypothetical protein
MTELAGTINITTDLGQQPEVIQIQLPGAPGPQGPQGIPGQANVLTIGTVTTRTPGTSATATITGVSPNQVLNLGIPSGLQGVQGDPNVLTIGTVTTTDAITGGSATITGTSPSQVLNLVLPRGYGVIPAGAAGTVLVKNTATDYDTAWETPTGTGSLVRKSYVDTTDANRKTYVDNADALAVKNTGQQVIDDSAGAVTDVVLTLKAPASSTGSHIALNLGSTTYGKLMIDNASGEVLIFNPFTSAQTSSNAVRLGNPNGQMRILPYNDGNVYVQSTLGGLVFSGVNGAKGAGTVEFNYTNAKFDGPIQAGGKITSVTDPTVAQDAATKNYVDTQDTATLNSARRPAFNQVGTAAYTFALTDEGKVVYYNTDASAVTYTIPLNSAVAFPVGTSFEVYQGSTGTVTIQGTAGVNMRVPDGTTTAVLRGIYSKVRVTKSAADTWQIYGDIANISTNATTNASASSGAGTLVKRDVNGNASMADPTATAHIATKNYVDGQITTPIAGARKLSAHWGSGTAFPTGNILTGDTFLHTGLGCIMQYNGTTWHQREVSIVANTAARTAISTTYSASLYAGFQVMQTDFNVRWEWTGTEWEARSPVIGKGWATANGNITYNAYVNIPTTGSRVIGGFTASTSALTVPYDGIYRIDHHWYLYGVNNATALFTVLRTRASVAAADIAVQLAVETSVDAQGSTVEGGIPLKAGDTLNQRAFGYASAGGQGYAAANEANGCSFTATYVSALHGATPF